MRFTIPSSRLYRWLCILFVIAALRRVTFTIDAVHEMQHVYPGNPFAVGSPWPTVTEAYEAATAAGVRAGDRILAIDGRAPAGDHDVALAFHSRSLGSTVPVSI